MKRFTETIKWRDPWYHHLSPTAKLLFLWLADHCDNAGVIDLDLKFATFDIGEPVEEKHVAELGDRLQKLPCGKWYLPKFVRFQFGDLQATSNVHRSVLRLIASHGLENITPASSHVNPIAIPSSSHKDVSMETPSTGKVQEKEKVQGKGAKLGSEHTAFIKGWADNFKSEFGFNYDFTGRDAKATQALLKVGVLRIDLLEIAKSAWKRGKIDPFATNCKKASTIFGFRDFFTQIRVELQNKGMQGRITNEKPQELSDAEILRQAQM